MYNGHTYCLKCGQMHWMHGPCPEPIAQSVAGANVEPEQTEAQKRAHLRKHTLNAKLRTLSEWAKNRADNPHHDVLTTLSMLRRKVDEINEAVCKASSSA
jgi:hypothetical protein